MVFDDEGDAILISTDDDLVEAVNLARKATHGGKVVVKLVAELDSGSSSDGPDPMVLAGIGAAVAAVAIGVLMTMSGGSQRPTRY